MDNKNDELRDYILPVLKEAQIERKGIDISISVTLPCGCCSEPRRFYADEEELEGKTDNQLIYLFEEKSEVYLDHVTDWSENYGTLFLDLY